MEIYDSLENYLKTVIEIVVSKDGGVMKQNDFGAK